jgi:hypothetical protein
MRAAFARAFEAKVAQGLILGPRLAMRARMCYDTLEKSEKEGIWQKAAEPTKVRKEAGNSRARKNKRKRD